MAEYLETPGVRLGGNFKHRIEQKGLYEGHIYPDNYVFSEADQHKEIEKVLLEMDYHNTDIETFQGGYWRFKSYPHSALSPQKPSYPTDTISFEGESYIHPSTQHTPIISITSMQPPTTPITPLTIPTPVPKADLVKQLGPDYAKQLGIISSPPKQPLPPITENPEIAQGLQELEEQESLKSQAHAGVGEEHGRTGLTLPGHKYIGPGGHLPAGKPTSKLDELAMEHDIGYNTEIKGGHNPYVWYNYYDQKMINDIWDNYDQIRNEGEQWLANLIISLWRAKKHITEPFHLLLKGIGYEDESLDPTVTQRLNSLKHFQAALGAQEKSPPSTKPQVKVRLSDLKVTLPPALFSGNHEDIEYHIPSHKESPYLPQEPPAKKLKPAQPPTMSTQCSSTTRCSEADDMDMGVDQTTFAGMPSSTTDSTIADIGVQGSGDCPGGGGGSQRCTNKWLGGIHWTHNTFTTYQTRRVMLTPFTNKYVAVSAIDNVPGIDVSTPWYYIDLNCFYSHIPPATMQEIIETTDGFKPLTLTVTITEIVGKDVSCASSSTSFPAQVTDSQTATILLHRDDKYELPYVIGGGQETVPEHLPGDWYRMPQYCYNTLGVEAGFIGNTDCSRDWYTRACVTFKSTQDSELFLLENLPNTQLHPGCTWTSTYKFPNLPMAKTTQYPWSVRRQDNPYQKQRIVSVRNCTNASSGDLPKQRIEIDTFPEDRASFRKPTMWLPANRHRDGDCQIIPPPGKEQHVLPTRNNQPPVIIVRQGIFSFETASSGVTSNIHTEQPGPPTEDKAVRTPGGTMVLTSNTLTVKRKTKVTGWHPHTIPYTDTDPKKRIYQLVIQNERGLGGPAEPDHVKERFIGSSGGVLPGSRYPLFQEITYGQHTGAPIEGESGFWEYQIWERNPNVDFFKGGHKPPLAQWAIQHPPPLILLRMLPMPCAPCQTKYTMTPKMKGIINSYVTFQLQYSIKWAYTPRHHTNRWNPTLPPMLPPPFPGRSVVYNLDTQSGSTENQYVLASESWQFKQRLRHNR